MYGDQKQRDLIYVARVCTSTEIYRVMKYFNTPCPISERVIGNVEGMCQRRKKHIRPAPIVVTLPGDVEMYYGKWINADIFLSLA